jgi:hypothetical protein
MTQLFWNYSDTLFPLLALFMLVLLQQHRKYMLLAIYLILTAGIMGYSNYLADRGINNMYLYHLYTLIEIVILLPMIASFSNIKPLAVILSIIIFTAFWIINVWKLEPLTKFNSNSGAVGALLITFFCFHYFLYLIKTDGILNFQKNPGFWIVSGLFFYCVVATFIIGSYKYKDWFSDSVISRRWRIQQVANIIKFILISIGILCCYRRPVMGGS